MHFYILLTAFFSAAGIAVAQHQDSDIFNARDLDMDMVQEFERQNSNKMEGLGSRDLDLNDMKSFIARNIIENDGLELVVRSAKNPEISCMGNHNLQVICPTTHYCSRAGARPILKDGAKVKNELCGTSCWCQ